MVDSKFFGIPFAVSGDKATIPEDTQPSGSISYQQGYGPDYERDPETDPLAKRVPRDETNELYYQITNAMRFLQLYGAPEWYAVDDNGNPVSYPVNATVRYDAGSGTQIWRSLQAANTATPGSDPLKWTLSDAFAFSTLEASAAEMLAATTGVKVVSPRRAVVPIQRGLWTNGAVGGTVNAVTLTLTPNPGVLVAGMRFSGVFTAANTGPATLNVNSLGAAPILNRSGGPLVGGELIGPVSFSYDGANWWADVGAPALGANRTYYVRSDGNDANTGLVNNAGGAFQTIQRAIDVAASLNCNGFSITISVSLAGTYGPVSLRTLSSASSATLVGDIATPANIITGPISNVGVSGWLVHGFKPAMTGTYTHNFLCSGGNVTIGNMEWPLNNNGAHIAAGAGGSLVVSGTQRIAGGAAIGHMFAADGGAIRAAISLPSLNVLTTVGFDAFVVAGVGNTQCTYASITNPANVTAGRKFKVIANGVVNTNGAGVNYYPGPDAGTTATGGQYI